MYDNAYQQYALEEKRTFSVYIFKNNLPEYVLATICYMAFIFPNRIWEFEENWKFVD